MKKAQAMQAINELPEKFHVDVLMEKLMVIEAIEKGISDARSGKTLSESQLDEDMKKWNDRMD
ncbi:MAG: hypothetical protein SH856_09580 [Flavobacteriales bacterium]|nr:hypothetical protein [Flavobacteriales bacterium]